MLHAKEQWEVFLAAKLCVGESGSGCYEVGATWRADLTPHIGAAGFQDSCAEAGSIEGVEGAHNHQQGNNPRHDF